MAAAKKDVDARDRPGHDVERVGLKDLHESCWNCKGKATGGGFAPGAASGVVRPPSAGAAVAAAKGKAGRGLRGVAVGNHAAADRGQNGRALFREIYGALAGCRLARPRLA